MYSSQVVPGLFAMNSNAKKMRLSCQAYSVAVCKAESGAGLRAFDG